MRKAILWSLLAVVLTAGVIWAADHVVTITWQGPGNPITVDPDPVSVRHGETIEFKLSEDSWAGGVCAVSAGPPLNWSIGPLYPGYPGLETGAITVPPGVYEYTIECGEAKEVYQGSIHVSSGIPVGSTIGLIVLTLMLLCAGFWLIWRRRSTATA